MASSIPTTQKAWLVVSQGKPSKALTLKEDHPVPSKLGSGEMLVKVQAAALNPVANKLMAMLPNLVAGRPLVPEYDIAGVVVDANGTHFSNGDEVFGWIPLDLNSKTKQGALSQYTRLPAANVVTRPATLKPTEAAGIPLVALTAYQALYKVGGLQPGQRVFINGGSTSVGIFAIQIAKAAGCFVGASGSKGSEELIRGLGADEFVDYTIGPLYKTLTEQTKEKYHIILEAVGLADPALYTHSTAYLVPDGKFMSVGPQPSGVSDVGALTRTIGNVLLPCWLGGVSRAWKLIQVAHNENDLESIKKLIVEGKMRPVIDSVYEFDDVLKAYERILTGHAKGKIIVRVDKAAT